MENCDFLGHKHKFWVKGLGDIHSIGDAEELLTHDREPLLPVFMTPLF
jgi:hypothetical protein